MKKISYLLAAFIILSLTSCEELFTTVREIDIPEHEQKLSVNAAIRGDSIGLFISHSKAINDDTLEKHIIANISVLENGNEILNFDYNNENNSELIEVKKLPENIKEGAEYTLIVDSQKFGIAKASDIAPYKPIIKDMSFDKKFIKGEYDEYNKFEFVIDDNASENNYYMFKFRIEYENQEMIRYSHIYAGNDDPQIISDYYRSNIFDKREYGSSFNLLSDKNFNGTKRKIVFKVYKPYNGNDDLKYKIFFIVKTISKTYYNFLIAESQAKSNNENPFAEPVVVSGNIENGYGIFATIFTSEYMIFEK